MSQNALHTPHKPYTYVCDVFGGSLQGLNVGKWTFWYVSMDHGSVYLKSVPLSAQSSGILDQRVYSDSSLDLGHPLPVPVWRLSTH